MDETENTKQYIYIVQASLEPSKCKIGKTNDLDRRLKEYNNMTGVSKENIYQYLFTCEVQNMAQVENDIKENFGYIREVKTKEIYFYNPDLLDRYVKFIKSHPLFAEEIFIKTDEKKEIVKIKIVEKTTPSLKERGLTRKDVMQKAKNKEDNEFYTRYEDVEKEVAMYDKKIWKDKCVFCNCDDAVDDEKDERRTSAFALYFIRNFKELGLKKLICTHYGGGLDIFNQGAKGYVYRYEFTREGFREFKESPKNYTGSFDDPLSLKILNEEADIVCTNPPFSRAIDYWKIVIESGKKFLILSSFLSITTVGYLNQLYKGKVWPGYNRVDWFLNPRKELRAIPTHWFTNIPISNRHKYKLLKIMPIDKIPAKYKKYDDAGTLLVDNCYIPDNYKYSFGVSVNPIFNGLLDKGYKIVQGNEYYPYIDGKRKYARVLVHKI